VCCFKTAAEQLEDLIITSSYEQTVRENRGEKSWMVLFTFVFIELAIQEMDQACLGNFLHFWVGLNIYVFLEKAIHRTRV